MVWPSHWWVGDVTRLSTDSSQEDVAGKAEIQPWFAIFDYPPTVSASSLRTALWRLTRHGSFILEGKSNIRRYEDVVFLSLIIMARLKVSQKQLTGSRRLERPFLMQNPWSWTCEDRFFQRLQQHACLHYLSHLRSPISHGRLLLSSLSPLFQSPSIIVTIALFVPSAFTNITWKTYIIFGV